MNHQMAVIVDQSSDGSAPGWIHLGSTHTEVGRKFAHPFAFVDISFWMK